MRLTLRLWAIIMFLYVSEYESNVFTKHFVSYLPPRVPLSCLLFCDWWNMTAVTKQFSTWINKVLHLSYAGSSRWRKERKGRAGSDSRWEHVLYLLESEQLPCLSVLPSHNGSAKPSSVALVWPTWQSYIIRVNRSHKHYNPLSKNTHFLFSINSWRPPSLNFGCQSARASSPKTIQVIPSLNKLYFWRKSCFVGSSES